MFINIKTLTTNKFDEVGQLMCTVNETVYLFDGQEANANTLDPKTQAYYKKLHAIQEEATLLEQRPVSIFEALKIGL